LVDIMKATRSLLFWSGQTMRIPKAEPEVDVLERILIRHILALFRDREKVPVRRNFICVIRQGGFKVVRPRGLKCCDVVILETALGPRDKVNARIVQQCVERYMFWELKF